MDAWYQCENPYPLVPQETLDRVDSVRASLPNRYCDPKVAADLNLNLHLLLLSTALAPLYRYNPILADCQPPSA